MSKTLVMKFGGTSVGNLERIENAARRVIKRLQEGYSVVVVSSAMAGETDRLINLAKQIDRFPQKGGGYAHKHRGTASHSPLCPHLKQAGGTCG